jgi:hypothetical protein
MSVYKVLSNLKRDGALFEKGEEIELDDKKVARELIEDGVIEEVGAHKGPMTPEQKKAAQEEKAEEAEPVEESVEEPVEEAEEASEESVEEAVEEKPDYSKMTKKDLLEVAKKKGVKIPASAKTNSAVAKLLEKHDKEASVADSL